MTYEEAIARINSITDPTAVVVAGVRYPEGDFHLVTLSPGSMKAFLDAEMHITYFKVWDD